MAPAVAPVPCAVKPRLLRAYLRAVQDHHRMQSAQMCSLVRGDGFRFEKEIQEAEQAREDAKYAILVHEQEHGCHLWFDPNAPADLQDGQEWPSGLA